MSLNLADVKRIAHLARIAVEEDEMPGYLQQLSNILNLVEEMQAVDTTGIEPMAHAQDVVLRLRNDVATATMQMHWFTPDGLADWGDGRSFIVGTAGYIELRKNLDLAGRPGGQHLFLVTNTKTEHIACEGQPVGTFSAFAADLRDRTENAMSQSHCFTVCRLALAAEEKALGTA